ncbi:MAG: PAS domain-containing sensor histidine kinase, partial [Chitinophagaceae bacterium]
LDKVYTTGIPFHAKNQRVDITANGVLQPFYFNYSFTPLYDSSGNIYGVMNTAADVSELVKAYNRLEESEARARLAIEASEQGTFHFNLLTGQLSASKRMAEIFDVSGTANREEYFAAIIREDLPVREKAFKRAEATGTLAYDVRIRRKDGKISWVRIKGKIYFDEGHPQKLVGVVQDITDQKHFAGLLEQKVEERTTELAELNKKLVSMNDELQQFAYIASHDMQEPLRKIRVFSDILAKQTEKGSQTGRYIDKINLAAERMTGLIHGLLEYSRTSDIRLRYEMVDLNIVLKNVLSDFELLISQKEAEVRVEDLPAIVAVPLQMNQLFYNLVGNSLKFTQDGVKPFIHISFFAINEEIMASLPELDRQREYVGISIADNGTGFDQIYASKIFTVFQRLNERDKFGGYGIGLALCKKVVEEHQGLISATSEAGRGARF